MRTHRPDQTALTFFAFDLLHENDVDLRGLPLSERQRDLERLVRKSRVPCLKLVENFPIGSVLLEHCNQLGIEGIVSKRRDKPYTSGVSKYWQKTKCEHWRRQNQNRYRLFERPKPAASRERERAVHRKKIELARIQERLAEPALRAGMKAALKAQVPCVAEHTDLSVPSAARRPCRRVYAAQSLQQPYVSQAFLTCRRPRFARWQRRSATPARPVS
jgi:ATP dependent DNA ligase domain